MDTGAGVGIRVKEEVRGGVGSKILTYLLPRRLKRAWFLATIIAVIEGIDDTDEETIRKFNELLDLLHSKKAIELPFHVKELVWENRLTENTIHLKDREISIFDLKNMKLDYSDLMAVAKFFSSLAPKCLVYGDDDKIAQDLGKIFGKEAAVI